MKQEFDLTPEDFVRHPVWIGVHNFDSDEPWYELSDEQTFRPWTGPLPFAEKRGFVLVSATFDLADGGQYPGYFTAVRENWDEPLPPRKMKDGNYTEPKQWSARRGGSPLSILSLHCPVIFLGGRSFDFHLKRPPRRKRYIKDFYAAIGKAPEAVFPVRFHADPGLAAGIVEGRMDGFYSFPLDKPFEIDTGETLLLETDDAPEPRVQPAPDDVVPPGVRQSSTLSPAEFDECPVWMQVPFADKSKPWYLQYAFRPWTGSLPVDPAKVPVIIAATFVLRDGREYPGCVRPIPENWADVVPPPTKLPGVSIQATSPRERSGDSLEARIEVQRPNIFLFGERVSFWCGPRSDCETVRPRFYKALGKSPDDIFPIRFQCTAGLATGIVSGEVQGFYEPVWSMGQPPKVVR
jgi:hypothetical protein